MKLSANQYTKALFSLTKDKPEEEIAGIVSNFIKLLQKNKQLKLTEKIIAKLSEIWGKEEGETEVKIQSSNKLSQESLEKIKEFVIQKYSAKKVVLSEEVKKDLRGGVILRIGDEMIDASVSGRISKLKKELIK